MKLENLIDLFIGSVKENWNQIECGGTGSGPSYKDSFTFHQRYDSQDNIITHASFNDLAVYKEDISITMAWGLPVINHSNEESELKKDWISKFPDGRVGHYRLVDLFYNNALVLRSEYVLVDGGNYKLPYPNTDGKGGYSCPKRYADFIGALHRITGTSSNMFDYAMSIAGITTTDEKWYY